MVEPSDDTYPPVLPGEESPLLLRRSEIKELLGSYGLNRKQCEIGAAVALAEAPGPITPDGEYTSDFNFIDDLELADDVWGYSYGGFQIRSMHVQKGTGLPRDQELLLDPAFNCMTAVAIRRAYGGWDQWESFTSGRYLNYMEDSVSPAVHTVGVGDLPTMHFVANKPSD